MNQKILAIAMVAVVLIAGISAAVFISNSGSNGGDDASSKDAAGYDIVPVDDLSGGIAVLGQDTFRWMTYFGLADRCIMVDLNDKTNYMGKAFMYVGKAQAINADGDLAFGSTNCGITPKEVGTIIDLKPSLVVVPASFETGYPQEMNALRAADLRIFHIANVYTFLEKDTFAITDEMESQIDSIGKVLKMENRASEIKKLINDTVSDLASLRSGIAERRNAYVGAIAYNGAHGIDSSMSYYMPFELAGIDNIMSDVNAEADPDSHVATYSATVIKERMKSDTMLFLDATGVFTCTTNTDKGIMELFKDHEAYISCPYIWTGINPENVLVGAYQLLRDAYGLLSDEEFEKKADAVYAGFLGTSESLRCETAAGVPAPEQGTSVYDDMSNMYLNRRGNPISGSISVDSDGIKYND